MKQKLLLTLIFITTLTVEAQDYKPLLDNFNEWQFTSCFSGCFTDVYFTDGDTIVDGKNYKILDGFHYISRTFLLREEVNNKKIYLNKVAPGHNEEFLLYDFSLNEGDIFNMLNPYSPFPADGGDFVLDSIVSRPLVDGNEYKHFYFSPAPGNPISTDNSVWVEGVGSLSLINAPGGSPDINQVGALSCFFKNAELFYSNLDSISGCKPIHLGINEIKNNLEAVILTKSINKNEFLLNNAENIKNFYVYDLTGKKLITVTNPGRNILNLNMSGQKSGMYLVLTQGVQNSKKVFKILVE